MKSVLSVIAALLGFFAVKYGVQQLFSDKDEIPKEIRENPAFAKIVDAGEASQDRINAAETVEEKLAIMEQAVASSLPVKVDAATTLVGVKAGPGKTFTYDYTLAGLGEVTAEQIETAMRPDLEAQYDGPHMRSFKKHRVTVTYRYSHENGALIGSFDIGP